MNAQRYPEEFRIEAVKQILEHSLSLKQPLTQQFHSATSDAHSSSGTSTSITGSSTISRYSVWML